MSKSKLFLFKKLKTNEKDLDIKSNAYATFASTLSQKDALILKLKDTLTRNEEELSLIQSEVGLAIEQTKK